MRCIAQTSGRTLRWRSWRSDQDDRCLRHALAGRKLCHQHAAIHDGIVRRILAIPPR